MWSYMVLKTRGHIGLTLLVVVLQCYLGFASAGMRVQARAADPDDWNPGVSYGDAPVDLDAAPLQEGLSQVDDTGGDDFETAAAVRRAQKQHTVMQQFMKNFARNMRYSVLADSRGDMPEAERQRLMREAEAEGAGSKSSDAGAGSAAFSPPAQEPEEAVDFQPQRRPSAQMLNALSKHHYGHHHARHTLRMLNARPLRRSSAMVHEDQDEQEPPLLASAQYTGHANLVRDSMGRAMPLLFASSTHTNEEASPVARGGVGCSARLSAMAAAAAVLSMFLTLCIAG